MRIVALLCGSCKSDPCFPTTGAMESAGARLGGQKELAESVLIEVLNPSRSSLGRSEPRPTKGGHPIRPFVHAFVSYN